MARSMVAAAPGVVRRPVKRLFRGFGVATSDFRPLPDYLIIGTHRGGTTSLHQYLQQHPCVGPPFPRLQNVKGVRYFDQNFFRGIDWYRSHFPTAAYRSYLRRLHGGPVVTGEASPYYLFHPAAAERAAEAVPQAKIIALLRDPIERAYSHWKRERRDGAEPLETFEDAIAAEPGRLEGEVERILSDDRYYSYAHENFSYISQGLYLDSLRRWLAHFPGEQVHVEVTECFLENPETVYDRVLRFLGLPPFALRDAERLNVTGQAAGQGLGSGTRRELSARIAPHNRRLEKFLGLELGWGGQ
ncbi:MAG TPA: sulfotransferase domain-containing protein [Solirubrobacterales bacterium]|nr:sulfotransferase domain-containing protein [Solirubrobacterales bacterium]